MCISLAHENNEVQILNPNLNLFQAEAHFKHFSGMGPTMGGAAMLS